MAPQVVTAAPPPGADTALVDALVESRQRFKDIVEVSGDFAWETDAQGAFVFVSPGMTIGYDSADLVGKPARRFLSDVGAARDTPFAARESVRDADIWLRTASGGLACLRTSAVPVLGADGAWQGARGVCRDVTEEHRRQTEVVSLQMREAMMARIVRAAASELDPHRMLATALAETRNALSAAHVDLRRPDACGTLGIVAAEPAEAADDAPVLKTILARMADGRSMVTAADGDRFYLCAPTVFRGEVTGTLLVTRPLADGAWRDDERSFSEELAAQFAVMLAQIDGHRKLEALARKDELTGLLNRRAFIDDLQDRIVRIGGGGASGAMLYVDLDNFKPVNDVHGHKRGDEALAALSDLLLANTRPGDLVARLGGDEFAMWLERTDEAAAARRAGELLEAAKGLRIFSGAPDRPLGISVGVALVESGSGESFEALAARADEAMYRVKQGGKAGFAVAAPAAAPPTATSGGTAGDSDAAARATA